MTRRRGFNLVEILITLSIVAMLTTIIVSSVADYKDKLRMVRVKNDLAVLSQTCKYIESTDASILVTSVSEPGAILTSTVSNYILSLPAEDPWGRQYWLNPVTKMAETTDSDGFAYVLDRGMGRIISPGPDGVCNTTIGYGLADKERDIVVEFRQTQWLVFCINAGIYLSRGDGSVAPEKIFDGRNIAVTPARDRFCCVSATAPFAVSWGLIDLQPSMQSAVNAALKNVNLHPFWAPDGVHIVVVSDAGHIWVINTATGQERCVTNSPPDPSPPIENQAAWLIGGVDIESKKRSIHTDERSAWYHFIQPPTDVGIYVTVSSDGKIAYFNKNHKGIEMVLMDGSGRRTIVRDTLGTGKKYLPLFWLDTENIVYMNATETVINRIKQDGSYDVSLFPSNPTNDTVAPVFAISPSPDRSMIAFNNNADFDRYRILRTDGSGYIKDTAGTAVDNYVPGSYRGTNALPLWHRLQRRLFIPAREDAGGLDTINELRLVSSAGELRFQGINSIEDNNASGLVPHAWSLDRSQNLLAIISVSSVGQKNGVYVYSIAGPPGAVTKISDLTPAGSTTFDIFWSE